MAQILAENGPVDSEISRDKLSPLSQKSPESHRISWEFPRFVAQILAETGPDDLKYLGINLPPISPESHRYSWNSPETVG